MIEEGCAEENDRFAGSSDGSVWAGGACGVRCRDHDLLPLGSRACGWGSADTRNVAEAVLRDLVVKDPFRFENERIGNKYCRCFILFPFSVHGRDSRAHSEQTSWLTARSKFCSEPLPVVRTLPFGQRTRQVGRTPTLSPEPGSGLQPSAARVRCGSAPRRPCVCATPPPPHSQTPRCGAAGACQPSILMRRSRRGALRRRSAAVTAAPGPSKMPPPAARVHCRLRRSGPAPRPLRAGCVAPPTARPSAAATAGWPHAPRADPRLAILGAPPARRAGCGLVVGVVTAVPPTTTAVGPQ